LQTYRQHTANLTSVAWSPDGQFIASGAADQTVQIWQAHTAVQNLVYRGHTGMITAAAWSPDGSAIASASADKSVQVWQAATGKLICAFRKHTAEVTSVAWSPDGKYLVSGSTDKTVQVWHATTGEVLYVYSGYNTDAAIKNPSQGVLPDLIYAVNWSRNGQWIAALTQMYCGDDCGEVLIWDALTRQHFRFYPTQPMYTLVLSPNDAYFVSSIGTTQVQVARGPLF
jgi:WD40 repeat protein